MAKVETVRIKTNNQNGYILINKADVESKHELFVEKSHKEKKEKKEKIKMSES